uniref:NECAP PHear domain-containing protein n=2 Tax=Corethron hystrix TaxID=216773 RepID=A0A7S1BJ77_9STRA|mmetsp:Transcript_30564/g.69937  ORF Transcript_30564/g.69937 Transcript_30564/m.69937 type:complete len:286 (+) Transcript_30564:49-906(+)
MEQKLLKVPEVFVYKVPALRSSTGYRAEEWGDLSAPFLTGSLALHQSESALILRLFRIVPDPSGPPGKTQEQLFARTDVELKTYKVVSDTSSPDLNPLHLLIEQRHVASVADSSRYFVLTITNAGRTMKVGLGFRDRDSAIDFRSAIQDYANSVWREIQAERMKNEGGPQHSDEGKNNLVKGVEDQMTNSFSLKEGEKIHVNVKGGRKREKREKSGGSRGILLKPPPPPIQLESEQKMKVSGNQSQKNVPEFKETPTLEKNKCKEEENSEEAFAEDDFGDFESFD